MKKFRATAVNPWQHDSILLVY